jgi:hypothetical protein
MKFMITGGAVIAMMTAAQATTDSMSLENFYELEDFQLTCESSILGKHHLVLEIRPESMMVKLHNEHGDIFDFPITDAGAYPSNYKNAYGHHVVVPNMAYIVFIDNGGLKRNIEFSSKEITYYSKGQNWQWSCIPKYF